MSILRCFHSIQHTRNPIPMTVYQSLYTGKGFSERMWKWQNNLSQLVFVVFSFFTGYQLIDEKKEERRRLSIGKQGTNSISINDIIGIDDYRHEVEQVVNFFKNASIYKDIGAEVCKGVLLYGQPGVGKTMLAKALASESAFSFIYTSGSEFGDKYVGGTAKKIRQLFNEASKKAPCVIFIDEIDAIGGKRSDDPTL